MSTEKFTSGPWEVLTFEHHVLIKTDKKDRFIGEINGNASPKQNILNANLIAAAPDMYAAFENTAMFLEDRFGTKDNAVLDEIKAALSKANPQPITEAK